jgi:long-chain acyl-CoA synthetase
MNQPNSLCAALTESCERNADKIALMRKLEGSYQGITYREFQDSAFALASKFLEMNVQKGDRIAVLSANRPEWAIVDFACLSAGAVLTPIYNSLSASQVHYILRDSGARMLFAENDAQAAKAAELKAKGELENIWVFDEAKEATVVATSFLQYIEEAKKNPDAGKSEVKQRIASITRDDLATLIYTSGTTGLPKGAMLTHGNLLSNREGAMQICHINPDDVLLSLLPLAHVFERLAGHFAPLITGATIAYAESPLTVAMNLTEVKPTMMLAVPRFYEKMQARILDAIKKGSPLKRRIFKWALKTGRKATKKNPQDPGGFKYNLADKLVFSKLRERTGGRLRLFVSGGAALPAEVGEFFQSAGMKVLEGYGLTESSPIICVNHPDDIKFGTVGKPIPNVEVKIGEDGEILAKGPNIMQGYLNLPGDTKAAIDEDGWLHTGDLGNFDDEGRLVITGRKKEIMVTSSGRNIAPTPIENTLKSSAYISEIMVIGDGRQYVTALIIPEFEQLEAEGLGAENGAKDREALIKTKQVRQLIEFEIERLSAGFSEYEQIVKFTLLPHEFSIEEGELTPTMKIKRKAVLEKYADIVDAMYAENPRDIDPNCCN